MALIVMVMLQNVCENCVRILEEEKHHQIRMFVIDKPKREKPKTVRTYENIAAVPESGTSFSTIEHFGDIIETNFA